MNFRTLILFSTIMLTTVAAFLSITDYQDKTYDMSAEYVFFSSTELKGFKPYRSKNNFNNQTGGFEDFPIVDNYYNSYFNTNSSSNYVNFSKNNQPITFKVHNSNGVTSSAVQGGGGDSGGLAFMSKRKSSGSNTASNTRSTASGINQSIYQSEMQNTRPIWFESQFGINDNGSLPDPGGNIDDECEDDVQFIPIPNGFWILIFFLTLYAFFKMDRITCLKRVIHSEEITI